MISLVSKGFPYKDCRLKSYLLQLFFVCIPGMSHCQLSPINFTFFNCNILLKGTMQPICAESAVKPRSISFGVWVSVMLPQKNQQETVCFCVATSSSKLNGSNRSLQDRQLTSLTDDHKAQATQSGLKCILRFSGILQIVSCRDANH